jgi:N-acyl homoserine lactone hydrolase
VPRAFKHLRLSAALPALWALLPSVQAVASPHFSEQPAVASPDVRLYALDCGRIEFRDMSLFSDTGDYDGKTGNMADPCFLIRHPRGTLLWDTGLGDKFVRQGDDVSQQGTEVAAGIRIFVDTSLQSQLQTLGLKPENINCVAFSHFHFDHLGNANMFTHSTWILNKTELAAALGPSPPFGVDKALISEHEHVQKQMIDGDYDVFGDGSVRILGAPGHTPGHQVLLLRLKNAGPVMLSGDLYHTRENRQFRRVPSINSERADTLASIDRFERMATNTKARVIIQHDPRDFRALPTFPGYLN